MEITYHIFRQVATNVFFESKYIDTLIFTTNKTFAYEMFKPDELRGLFEEYILAESLNQLLYLLQQDATVTYFIDKRTTNAHR
jgi:hypothetical protein